MISVVIPTMWRYLPFVSFINNLCQLDTVDDIILINNDVEKTPHEDLRLTSKVKVINCDQNLYVNPSWNLGVSLAKNDNICIINDDVMVDFKVFIVMDHFMTHNKDFFGLGGIHPGDKYYNHIPFVNGQIDLIPWRDDFHNSSAGMRFGLGTLFFISKSNWVDIPDGLDFYYGDDWAFETQMINGKQNYLIANCLYHTPSAQTCKEIMKTLDYNHILLTESVIYTKNINEYLNSKQVA